MAPGHVVVSEKKEDIQHDLDELVQQARQSDERDRQLSIREALKTYKAAVFWAMILSTSLIMEGFDLVTVSAELSPNSTRSQGFVLHTLYRSIHSMAKSNSKIDLESKTRRNLGLNQFLQAGKAVCPTHPWWVSLLGLSSIRGPKIDLAADLP